MRRRAGRVYLDGVEAGILEEIDNEFRFTYNSKYLQHGPPIFHMLPLHEEPFIKSRLHACFHKLASEGWLRSVQCRIQRIDPSDTFGLILANGLDMLGAVTIEPIEPDERGE